MGSEDLVRIRKVMRYKLEAFEVISSLLSHPQLLIAAEPSKVYTAIAASSAP